MPALAWLVLGIVGLVLLGLGACCLIRPSNPGQERPPRYRR